MLQVTIFIFHSQQLVYTPLFTFLYKESIKLSQLVVCQSKFMKKRRLKYLRWIGKAFTNKKTKSAFFFKKRSKHYSGKQKYSSLLQAGVPQTNETSFFTYLEQNIQTSPTPIKIKLLDSFKFTYPQKIVIRVEKKTHQTKTDQIDYKFNNQNVMYIEVNAEQFLSSSYKKDMNSDKENYSVSVPQMTLHKRNYELPKIIQQYFMRINKPVYAVNLWHYKKKTVTKWHYDCHDNFLFQLKGNKKVQLLPPNSPYLISINKTHEPQTLLPKQNYIPCESVFSIDNNHADELRISPNQFQTDPRLQVALIKENQCLFIPKGWFHNVISFLDSQGDNVAVNCWGNTVPTHDLPFDQLEINLKQLIYQFSQQICQLKYNDWQQIPQDTKEKFRKAHFCHYLSNLNPS